MKKLIVVFLLVGMVAGIFIEEPKKIIKNPLDFNLLINDRSALFQKIKYKNGGESRDYSYCDNEKNIYDVIDDSTFERLIIVCKLEYKTDHSHTQFFKYSSLYNDGKLSFCGWRDFDYSFNAYKKNWEYKFADGYSDKAYSSEKNCTNFDIKNYNHGNS